MAENLLDVRQVAAELHLAPSTIYGFVREGRIPCVKIGAAIRFRRGTLERWLEIQEARAQGRVEA